MGEVTNNTLAALMVFAMFVSLGGLFLTVVRVGDFGGITGLATSGTGNVTLSVGGQNSITMTVAEINFGACTPDAGTGTNITSNLSSSPSQCSSGTYPGNLTVQNDGNQPVNVTFTSSILPAALIGGATPTAPQLYYTTNNATYRSGDGCSNRSIRCYNCLCDGSAGSNCTWVREWTQITSTTNDYDACGNLSTQGFFDLYAGVFIPADAPSSTDSNTTLTFTANAFP